MSETAIPQPATSPSRRGLVAVVAGLAVFLAVQGLAMLQPGVVDLVFRDVTARLASVFLGAPLDASGDVPRILIPELEIAVTAACGGFDFFCLVLALWVGWDLRSRPRGGPGWLLLLGAPLGAYLVTLVGNISRIACASQARLATKWVLSDSYQPILHQVVGVVVFVTVLFLFWLILTKYYDSRRFHGEPG